MQQSHKEPFRSIEEISHLFLSGTLDDPPSGSTVKDSCELTDGGKRVIPRYARPELLDEPPSTSLTRNSFFFCSSDTLRPARTLITAHLGLELARRGFRVAAVETSHQSPNLMELLPDRGGAGTAENFTFGFWDSEGGLGDALNMFTALYREADIIVVNSTPDVTGIESFVWLLNPFYVILTTPTRSDLLTAYQSLKRVSCSSPSERMGLLIAGDPHSDTTGPAFRVVSGMVQKFLSRDLIFVGNLPERLNILATMHDPSALSAAVRDPESSSHMVKLADMLVARSGALR